jgi:hypothetical protein
MRVASDMTVRSLRVDAATAKAADMHAAGPDHLVPSAAVAQQLATQEVGLYTKTFKHSQVQQPQQEDNAASIMYKENKATHCTGVRSC